MAKPKESPWIPPSSESEVDNIVLVAGHYCTDPCNIICRLKCSEACARCEVKNKNPDPVAEKNWEFWRGWVDGYFAPLDPAS